MSFEDDKRFEEQLRRAFGAEDPGEVFTQRVVNRVKVDATRAVPPVSSARATWWVALPFAASLVIAAGGVAWVQHARHVEEGERARAQVLSALRLTREKLNVVRSAVIQAQELR
jgi:hypothetical protein